MGIADPKVFFSNERTYLQWLNTSVTIGSIGSALLGFSGMAAQSATNHAKGFDGLRVVGLLMIALSIMFCAHAMYQYNRRAKLLKKRVGTGYDDSSAPVMLSIILVVALSAIYVTYLTKNATVHL
mmetsp:Transcript_8624/g.13984  ORF Transcript_8624/g.13984 Transcript_8624/m.13984 type:complete len:125 (+) Transcript_8624:156-530(+)|eukprot:CAMPEP_0203760696 /NCGR_PEP_ID=MMETSP0098-20131031/13940_1 /ASSEMBLY_ACC=CAM_ASM_000208 /TAXON_ID=96639 /ORGANISM=" , Strain NY0313808BC1" /LENGTH=124 /DNA_ID=CAMNT_0050654375 /DNA_START=101 /DNA_END=475 /DNA_ORIENTATION=+